MSCEYQENRLYFSRSAARNSGLLLAISFVVATTIFGCSAQRAPESSVHTGRHHLELFICSSAEQA